MPFSSLHDPADLARACRLLDTAWARIGERCVGRGESESERTQLAYMIAALLRSGESDEMLIEAAIKRYVAAAEEGSGTGSTASR